ncbi:hypothetical protein FSP39_007374 [Pinctada imbricata]|uniref:Potassium channel domain-containing protein n=1 Tax=Pinctada imbricata TaxID=66713 RepID=A0AA88XVS6_PINIB|nr:hypothetical protein FSP39_007374 [Pinctada imbricata]
MVLRYSLLSSLKELLILLIYTLIAVNVFANFIHLAEEKYDIGTIPKAWYFGIVTMTTVGYGDLQPISTVGRFFASIGALSGIILVALIVPIIVNNYMSLYQVANFVCHRSSAEKIAKKKETSKKKKNPYCLQKILPSSK